MAIAYIHEPQGCSQGEYRSALQGCPVNRPAAPKANTAMREAGVAC